MGAKIVAQGLFLLLLQAEFHCRREHNFCLSRAKRPLGICIEGADALDLIVKKGNAPGRFAAWRENLQNFPAPGNLAGTFHHGAALIAHGNQRLRKLCRRENRALLQREKASVELCRRAHLKKQAVHG